MINRYLLTLGLLCPMVARAQLANDTLYSDTVDQLTEVVTKEYVDDSFVDAGQQKYIERNNPDVLNGGSDFNFRDADQFNVNCLYGAAVGNDQRFCLNGDGSIELLAGADDVDITVGWANPSSAAGGDLILSAQTSLLTTPGGSVFITAGDADVTVGTGGDVNIEAGNQNAVQGGSVSVLNSSVNMSVEKVLDTVDYLTTAGTPVGTRPVEFGAGATYYHCDDTGGNIIMRLPATPDEGRVYHIKKIGSANTVTIDRNGKNIEGAAADIVLSTQYESVHIVYDGTEWWIH